jgi:gamma-F420-2:alpha-L-glutamate ligase
VPIILEPHKPRLHILFSQQSKEEFAGQALTAAGIPIPRTILGKFPVDVDLVDRELGFPVVVKTVKGTRGSGVLLCENREKFDELASLLDGAKPGADFIFQRYIKASHGRDVRLFVVGGRVVAAMERRARDGGFRSNISLGGEGHTFVPPPDMAALVVRAAEILDLDVAGIDVLFDDSGYRVCEANSAPGFHGLEAACGIDVPEQIFHWLGNRADAYPGHLRRWYGLARKGLSDLYETLGAD